MSASPREAELHRKHVALSIGVLDAWCHGAPGERSYELSYPQGRCRVRLRADRNGLLTEQTEKPTKADALASAAMIVTHNPYLE